MRSAEGLSAQRESRLLPSLTDIGGFAATRGCTPCAAYAAIPAHPQKQYTRLWRLYHFCGFSFYPGGDTHSHLGEYDITADELLSGAGGNTATKTEQAEKLILDLLADGKELASEDIDKAAAEAGISARTVRAAKKNLDGRITSKRIGAAWYHALKK